MLLKKEQKFIKSLKIKKYRLLEKRFLVEGAKNVQELLNANFTIDLMVGTDQFFSKIHFNTNEIRKEVVSEALLSQLGTFKTNEAVLAVVEMKDIGTFDHQLFDHLFVLDGVGDPGNLGTIIRTLDWFGFSRLLCSKDCAEFYHPKTIASSMGSFTRVSVFYENLEEVLKEIQVPIYGADANGSSIYETDIAGASAIVMGSESHGISSGVQDLITQKIAIPSFGGAESLNVGIATGILASYLRMSK